MQLTIQGVVAMVAQAAAAAQAKCTQLLDLASGSPGLAILQGSAGLWDVQQANVYRLLKASRLVTSSGTDVDSFVGDYGLVRDPATYATTLESFTRFSPTGSATVPVGATVRTGDLSQTYTVTEDPTNTFWSDSVSGYVLPVGTATITAPIIASIAGSAGNVVAGAISAPGMNIPGIDLVTNAAAAVNGLDAETDASLKVRFVGYIASLAKGTVQACLSAVASVQQGLSCTLRENMDEIGGFRPGHFVVVVDDGSGSPPSSLLTAVQAAVDLVRPLTVTYSVQRPTVILVSVQLTITVDSTGVKANLLARVAAAVTAYVDSTAAGGTLSVQRIGNAAFGVDPSISNVSGITVTGLTDWPTTSDATAPATTVIKASSVTVS